MVISINRSQSIHHAAPRGGVGRDQAARDAKERRRGEGAKKNRRREREVDEHAARNFVEIHGVQRQPRARAAQRAADDGQGKRLSENQSEDLPAREADSLQNRDSRSRESRARAVSNWVQWAQFERLIRCEVSSSSSTGNHYSDSLSGAT